MTAHNRPTVFAIYLSGWVIQDGNYPDFSIGDVHRFALEFWFDQPLKITASGGGERRSCELVNNDEYQVNAEVVHCTRNWWAIDFGLLAYREDEPPARVGPGTSAAGTIRLGVDPFFYFEYLHGRPGAPAMIYEWRVERIGIEVAPYIERGGVYVRDPERREWRDIAATDAWHDDGGHADYLLHCRLLDNRAIRQP